MILGSFQRPQLASTSVHGSMACLLYFVLAPRSPSPENVVILTTSCSDSNHTMFRFSPYHVPILITSWWFLPHHGGSHHTMFRFSPYHGSDWCSTQSCYKNVYFSQQWLGLQREVATRNHYKSLCNNLQIIYMKDLDLVRCFYFHEKKTKHTHNTLLYVSINDCL